MPAARPRRHRAEIAILAIGLVILLAWVAHRVRDSRTGATPSTEAAADGAGSARAPIRPEDLASLSWEAVEPAAATATADAFLAATADTRHPPARYLRALLLLARSEAATALATFDAIGPDQIPSSHLYAPYRLHGALKPGQPNPYLPGLLAALDRDTLDPLVAARVQAREGAFGQAVQAYLRTDPARWVSQDLELFRVMLSHEAFAGETRILIQAALRGNRVPPALRRDLSQLRPPTGPATNNATNLLRGRLTEYFRRNPADLGLAVTGAVQQLAVRRQFLERQYAGLLRQHRDADAGRLSDETVLLLVLAAAREADDLALDRWSQELRRRHPEREVEEWLKSIRTAAP